MFVNHIETEKELYLLDEIVRPLVICIKISVEHWLSNFDDAEFVLTDFFHGCVFSIIFRKQFLAIGNKERGLRCFHSLLTLFPLQDRLMLSSDEYKGNLSSIDYDQVQDRM